MGIKKGDIVRITEGNKQIGEFFRVTNSTEARFAYCKIIKRGITQSKDYYMRKSVLTAVPYTGITISFEKMEQLKKDYFPQSAMVLPYCPCWEKIFSKKKENPSLILHLYTNNSEEMWIKFFSAVRTTTNDLPTITLFGVEYVS